LFIIASHLFKTDQVSMTIIANFNIFLPQFSAVICTVTCIVVIFSNLIFFSQIAAVGVVNELAVGCFLFLTGYTQFMNFWKTGNLSLKKTAKVIN